MLTFFLKFHLTGKICILCAPILKKTTNIYNLVCLFVLAKVWLHSFFQPCFTGDKAQGVSLLYASASKGNCFFQSYCFPLTVLRFICYSSRAFLLKLA